MKSYRDIGLETYGTKCEICAHGFVEVHHISYQEHQEQEDMLRYLTKNKQPIDKELAEARKAGFLYWNGGQLSKDDRAENLAVLCPNCHTLMHLLNVGMKILKVLSVRVSHIDTNK